jgi:glycosyltransferase involved in cell wall biosynthesis
MGAVNVRIDVVVGRTWHAGSLATALADLGHDVRLTTADRSFVVPATRIPMQSLFRAGRILAPTIAPINLAFGGLAASRIRRCDLIIAWSSFALPLLYFRRKTPTVVVRGSHHIRRQAQLLGPDSGPSSAIVRLEEAEYRRAAFVSVPTAEIAADPLFPARGALALECPYGFPTPSVTPRMRPPSRPRILFAGEIGYRKGIDRLAAAFGEPTQDFDVVLAGPLGVKSASLPRHWRHLGILRHHELQLEMSRSTCLALPSREEGMARVGQEALSVGLPVIATPEAGLSRWLQDGAGVLVSSKAGALELMSAARLVIDNGESMRSRAVEASGRWDWRAHAELLLSQVMNV